MVRKLCSLILLLSVAAHAECPDRGPCPDPETRSPERISPDTTRVVRYTVTLYRDTDSYDKETWNKVCDCVDRVRDEGGLDDLYRTTKEVMRVTKGQEKGIHGEFRLSSGDGMPKSCCGENCDCAERYRGACPCTPGDCCN